MDKCSPKDVQYPNTHYPEILNSQSSVKKKYSTLNLPAELRLIVLQEILAVSWPVSFLAFHSNYHWRQTRPWREQDEDIANRELIIQFFSLCHISRNMREEAQQVMFKSNTWQLELCLEKLKTPHHAEMIVEMPRVGMPRHRAGRNLGRLHGCPNCLGGVKLQGTDTASAIDIFWGVEALLRMRKITFYVQGSIWNHPWRRPGDSASEAIKSRLLSLVRLLSQKSAKVEEVEVYFHEYAHDQWWGALANFETKQWILQPFEHLTGLKQAVVKGCVKPRWARHLEQCMTSKRDEIAVNSNK